MGQFIGYGLLRNQKERTNSQEGPITSPG